jgi:predicted amidohydrolase
VTGTRLAGEIRVALAQIATCPGQLASNLSRHLEMAQRAREAGAQLVVFPELSLTGYLLAHGVHELAFEVGDARLAPLLEASRELALLVGVPLRRQGGGIVNAALLLEDGAVRAVHEKLYLPTYGMFDEGRYFVPGRSLAPLRSALGTFGVLLCEDAWHLSSAVLLARQQVDAFLLVAGGPTELDAGDQPAGLRRWHAIVTAIAATTVTPVLFANRCGWEEGVLFAGGSWAVDARGARLVDPAPALEESLLLVDLSLPAVRYTRSLHPIPQSERLELWRAALEGEHG